MPWLYVPFFFGIEILPLPDAVTLQFTVPPFAAIFAVCLVGESWYFIDQMGAIVCLLGVILIAHPTVLFGSTTTTTNHDNDNTTNEDDNAVAAAAWLQLVAVLVCTGGAALAGVAYVTVRRIGNRASAAVMVLYYGTWSIPITILGSGLLRNGTWNVWNKDIVHDDYDNNNGDTTTTTLSFTTMEWCLLWIMGLAGYAGQLFTNLGLQHEKAATTTLATSTQIVWTYLFEYMFLHETLQLWSLLGTILILGYMILVGVLKFVTPTTTTLNTAAANNDNDNNNNIDENSNNNNNNNQVVDGEQVPLLARTLSSF